MIHEVEEVAEGARVTVGDFDIVRGIVVLEVLASVRRVLQQNGFGQGKRLNSLKADDNVDRVVVPLTFSSQLWEQRSGVRVRYLIGILSTRAFPTSSTLAAGLWPTVFLLRERGALLAAALAVFEACWLFGS